MVDFSALDFMDDYDYATINERELVSLVAMINFVADIQKWQPEVVAALVEREFDVHEYTKLLRRDYQHAMEYLVDLNG